MTDTFVLPSGKKAIIERMTPEVENWLNAQGARPMTMEDTSGAFDSSSTPEQIATEIADIRNPRDRAQAMNALSKQLKGSGGSLPPPLKLPTSSGGGKDFLKSIASGVGEGVLRAPLIAGDLANLGMRGINKIFPETFDKSTIDRAGSQGWIDAFKNDSPQDRWLKGNVGYDLAYTPQTHAGEYAKAGASSLAGASTLSLLGGSPKLALSPGSAAVNTGAGLGAQLGYDVSRDFDMTKSGNPLMAILAGGAVGLGGNLARSLMSKNMDQLVYNSTKDMKPENWKAAEQGLKDFERAGSTSFTLADLPELQSRIGGVAQGLSNTTGGGLLQKKLGLQDRFNTDIPNLIKSASDNISPSFDPRQLAAQISSLGEDKIQNAVKTRSTALEGALRAAPDILPEELKKASLPVRLAGIDPGNQGVGMQKALQQAEIALLGPESVKMPTLNQVIPANTNVRSLSQNVKALRKIPAVSTESPATGISRSQQMKAGDLAEQALTQASPQFRQALDQYKEFNENILNPMESSFVGGSRGVTDAQSLVSKLRKVPSDQIAKELNTLGASAQQQRQIARLLAEQSDVMPNATFVGGASKLDRQLLNNILEGVNPDLASNVLRKLNTSDALSRISAPNSPDRTMGLNLSKNPISTIVNPTGTVGLRAGLRTSEAEVARLSELLANPTAENLAKFKALSGIDPRDKRMLNLLTSMGGATQNSGVMQSSDK